jgi:hypothetical protein
MTILFLGESGVSVLESIGIRHPEGSFEGIQGKEPGRFFMGFPPGVFFRMT